jgi:hypothetical protein
MADPKAFEREVEEFRSLQQGTIALAVLLARSPQSPPLPARPPAGRRARAPKNNAHAAPRCCCDQNTKQNTPLRHNADMQKLQEQRQQLVAQQGENEMVLDVRV